MSAMTNKQREKLIYRVANLSGQDHIAVRQYITRNPLITPTQHARIAEAMGLLDLDPKTLQRPIKARVC